MCKWVAFILITVKTSTQLICFDNQGRTGPTKVADVLSTSRISKSTFLTLNQLALNKMQCTNHCQSSNKPNTGELNDFTLFRYSRVLWSNGKGKAFVRQGVFNSEGHLLQTVCGKSFNLRQELGLYLYLKRSFYQIMYFIRCQRSSRARSTMGKKMW